MKAEEIKNIARITTKKEADLVLECLKCFAGTQVDPAANGIRNVLMAYSVNTAAEIEESEEGEKIAKAIMKEEAKLIVKCLREFAGTQVAGVARGMTEKLEAFIKA